MKKHVLLGMCTMAIWCIFLLGLFGVYLIITHQSISYFYDAETGYVGFIFFFILWLIIWYKIGSHYGSIYIAEKELYQKNHPKLSEKVIKNNILKQYVEKLSKTLAIVFGTAVPWYVIGNVRDEVRTKDAIYIGLLMLLAIFFASSYKYYKSRK